MSTPLTQTEVFRMPVHLVKAHVGKDRRFSGDAVHDVLRGAAIVDIGGITVPFDDQSQLVLQQTQLASHSPAAVGLAIATDLLRTPPSFRRWINYMSQVSITVNTVGSAIKQSSYLRYVLNKRNRRVRCNNWGNRDK